MINFKMPERKVQKKILIWTVVILFLYFFLLPYILRPYYTKNVSEDPLLGELYTGEKITFFDSLKSIRRVSPDEFEEINNKNDYEGVLNNSPDYWKNWHWRTKYVKLRASTFNLETNVLTATLVKPDGHILENIKRDFGYSCTNEETIIQAYEVSASAGIFPPDFDGNFDYLDSMSELIEPGTFLYAYCSNEECTALGRECILELPLE